MRVLIISDIHGNVDALRALDEQVMRGGRPPHAVMVLGDLVDYGPDPAAVIDWVRSHATDGIAGNHDYAMATGGDCRSSTLFRPFAVATRECTRRNLNQERLRWLGTLPYGRRLGPPHEWFLVHATPRAPLFEYLGAAAPDGEWRAACGPLQQSTKVVLVGHSHEPFIRVVDGRTIVNPGSLGLPKDGDPRASYAWFEDGRFSLHRLPYDVDRAVTRLEALPLPREITVPLAAVLRTGDSKALAQPTRETR